MQKKNAFFDFCFSYLLIISCAVLSAMSFHLFILYNRFAPSGINGLATMIQYLFDFKIGYLNLLINLPLALIAFFVIDRRFAMRSAIYSLAFSVAILWLERADLTPFLYHTDNGTSTVLAPVAAGAIGGLVSGLTLKALGSTGGTDIIAALLHKWKPKWEMVKLIFGLNVTVAVLSYFIYGFDIEPVLLCIIYCFIIGRVSNTILQGGKEAVKFEVITDDGEALSGRLIGELHHGVTVLHATGMYSHTDKQMLLCVVNKHQIVAFQNILSEFPNTFAYISTVRETVGNFKNIH